MKQASLSKASATDLAFARRGLVELCAIDTTSGREGQIRPRLETLLAELDARVIAQPVGSEGDPARANILATWGQPRVLLTTHLDTVPPFFPPREIEGGLAGRGTCDAKGQAVAQLGAIRRLLRDGLSDLAWLGVVGEETSSDGARAALELSQVLPTVRAVINGEPTGGNLATGQKGFLHLVLRCQGERAHGSEAAADPRSGLNALWRLHDWLTALRDLPLAHHPRFGVETWNLGLVEGGEAANVVAGEARAELVARTVPGSTFRADVERLAPDSALASTVETILDESPTALDVLPGFPTEPVAFGSDAPRFRSLANGGRLLMCGPGSIRVAHTDHEHLTWDDLSAGIDQIATLCRLLLTEGASR